MPARPEEWIYKLVQATQDAVVTINAASEVVLFNASAERMFGYTAAEVRGKDVSVLMPQPYREQHADYVSRYEQTGERRAIGRIRTVSGQRKNGEMFPAELSVTEISVGALKQYGAFIRDISDKERLQHELVERERLAAIGTTAAKFAHEVSNPLNGMYTQAQLMRRRLDRSESVVHERVGAGIDLLLRDIERLNALLAEFRSMSRREDFRFSPTVLGDLCAEIVETQRLVYRDAGLRVALNIAADLPPVRADAAKLKQVLLNLLKNADEATPGGGEVELRASTNGSGRIVIEVADTGGGVPDGLDVFAPFETTKPAGTGLGLAIVRHIVHAHDGTITHCPNEGGGTTFTVELPVAETTAADEAER